MMPRLTTPMLLALALGSCQSTPENLSRVELVLDKVP